MSKKRLDQLLFDQGFVSSRQRAQALIMAGKVLVNDQPITKPGHFIDESAILRLRGEDHPYVSRGGLKLAEAIEKFQISVTGRTALDVGASTGGFTHVLLLNQIHKVYAVDVGYNQMDWSIRQSPKVILKEKVNARYLTFEEIGERVGLIVVDVSFISLEKILPALVQFALPETDWITLIKPQFEVGREKVGKGGIVVSETDRLEVIDRISNFAKTLGLVRNGLIESPIVGMDGNKEYLAHWKLS